MSDVVTDPEVPPLPPHITLEQARAFRRPTLHGDAERREMLGQSILQKLAELLPGHR